jgi:hypothetical protein
LSWPQLYRQIEKTRYFDDRLKMLSAIRSFYGPGKRFSDLTLEQRWKVGGICADEPMLKWRLFGSMAGAIPFKQRIRDNRQEISKALNCIPWCSAVTSSHFQQFLEIFRTAFVYAKPYNGLATASRLLAIKRPDYFMCVDGPNKKPLATKLRVPVSSFTLDSYWDLTLQLIDTPWWG